MKHAIGCPAFRAKYGVCSCGAHKSNNPAADIGRFFLSQDQSSHWYIVPVSRRKEWDEWCEIAEDDEAGWEAPEWAKPVGGSPSLITFTDPA